MLWICLHFPQLALEVFNPADDIPLVVETTQQQRRQVMLVSVAAQQAGVEVGMSIPSAYGVCDTLQVKARDETLEQTTLQRIALLAYQFTPHLTIASADTLVMEVETSLRLFGGCDVLLQCLQTALADEALSYTLACFPTAKGAIALARCAVPLNQSAIFPLEALADCPLHATEIPAAQVSCMQGMGLHTLGDLFALPSAALGKRFGQGTLFYLHQLRGLQPDIRPQYTLPPQFHSRFELGHETIQQQALLFPLKRLLSALENYLHARQLLTTAVTLILKRRDLSEERITLTPAQGLLKGEELLSLFRLRLEQQTLRQPVIALSVESQDFTPWKPIAEDLFDTRAGQQLTPQALVDRLQARLGIANVSGLRPQEDHRPERAWQAIPPGLRGATARTPYPRPLWLLETPRALTSKKGLPCDGAPLQLLQGPERIDSGWWDQQPVQRDYYIARHPSGALYWIYRSAQPPQTWFLHGLFS